MVKVLLFRMFDRSQVVSCEEEPQQICTSRDMFFIATSEGSVKVYRLSEDSVLTHQFRTIWSVILAVHYVPAIDVCVAARTVFSSLFK